MECTEMLKQEFLDRRKRRPAYSERAFARDLKVSPGYISLLFRGQRALSPAKALEIGQRLGWSEDKVERFVGIVQNQNLKRAAGRVRKTRDSSGFSELDVDRFRFIADLNHLAILSLVQSREVRNAKQAAEALDIPIIEAELALSRLIRLGLISGAHNIFKQTKNNLEIKEIPSDAIRALHRQALAKAEAAIEGQSIEERNLATLTLSFDISRMPEAKVFIQKFLKNFQRKFGAAPNGEIYQMSTQLFKLSRRSGK